MLMIDIKQIPIGTIIYTACEKNDYFKRKRIYFTDSYGIQWERYDREEFSYQIKSFKLMAIVEFTITGTGIDVDDYATEYHLMCLKDSKMHEMYIEDLFFNKCYMSEEEAEMHNDELHEYRLQSKL